jgi:hypothetical protein
MLFRNFLQQDVSKFSPFRPWGAKQRDGGLPTRAAFLLTMQGMES